MKSSKNNQNRNDKGIIRVEKNRLNPYVMINKELLENTNLSWKAKGLLAYLLSKPDNWQVQVRNLMNQSSDGEKSVRSGLKELEKFHYLQKFPVFIDHGISHWESIVYEIPFNIENKIKLKKILNGIEYIVYEKNPKQELQVQLEDFIDINNNEIIENNSKNLQQSPITATSQSQSIVAQKGEEHETQLESIVAGFVDVQNVDVQNVHVQKVPPNNKGIIINNDYNNKSVNQSVNNNNIDPKKHPILSKIQNINNTEIDENIKTEGLTESTINPSSDSLAKDLNHYETLMDKCQVEFLGQYSKAIKQALRSFFFCTARTMTINNQTLPIEIIKQDLLDLDFDKLNCAITKFRASAEKRDITNKVKYLQSCIYDAIFDYDITIKTDSDLIKKQGAMYYMPEKTY